jgi:hypothetical protein
MMDNNERMTEEEIERNALSDPDALPFDDDWEDAVLVYPDSDRGKWVEPWMETSEDVITAGSKTHLSYQERVKQLKNRFYSLNKPLSTSTSRED